MPTDYWLVNNAKVFATFAGSDARRWREAMGHGIEHVSLGSGVIVGIAEANSPECVTIIVQFDRSPETPKAFTPRHFLKANLFSDLAIPLHVAIPGQVMETLWQDQSHRSETRKAHQAREDQRAEERNRQLLEAARQQAEREELRREHERIKQEEVAYQARLIRERERARKDEEIRRHVEHERRQAISVQFKASTDMPSAASSFRIHGVGWTGRALDVHSLSSVLLTDGRYDTQRTEVGELLHRLKYRFDRQAIEPLALCAARFLVDHPLLPSIAAILPVPPSNTNRPFQPVEEVALRIGHWTNVPCRRDYLVKAKVTAPLKNIDDPSLRRGQLAGAFAVSDTMYAGKSVLVFDDIYRSGETLNSVAETLKTHGKVANVYVLTLTKTRSRT